MMPLMVGRKRLLGVDIDSAYVKMLELSWAGGNCRVESYALEALPPDAVVERNISDVGKVGEALRQAHARSGSRRRRVAVAVGGPTVIAKHITLDAALTDTQLLDRITADADRHIPFPLDEVAIDIEVLGLSERQPDRVDVLLVACRKRSIDMLRATLLAADLRPVVVEPQGQAVERVFRLLFPDIERRAGELVVVVADIGASVVALWVLVDGRAIFSREQALGGKPLVPTTLGGDPRKDGTIAEHDAHRAAMGLAGAPGGRTFVADVSHIDAVVRGLSQSLRYFYSSTHYNDIDRLLLIGDAAAAPGMAGALQNALEVPVAVADPFTQMTFAPGVDAAALSKNAPELVSCCGVAMRDRV